MIGSGTTDAIFIVRQTQETYFKKKQNLFFAFIDQEKPLIEFPEKDYGGVYGKWIYQNGLST